MGLNIATFPILFSDQSQLPDPPLRSASDQAPTYQFISAFFSDHKGKILAVGIAAILAGMILVALDIYTAGAVLPFTMHLTVSLFSFGATTIGLGVTSAFLTGEHPDDGNGAGPDEAIRQVVKPRGKRCSRHYLPRNLHKFRA